MVQAMGVPHSGIHFFRLQELFVHKLNIIGFLMLGVRQIETLMWIAGGQKRR